MALGRSNTRTEWSGFMLSAVLILSVVSSAGYGGVLPRVPAMTKKSILLVLGVLLALTGCNENPQPARNLTSTGGPTSDSGPATSAEASAVSADEWLTGNASQFEEAFVQADEIMRELASAPTVEVCQQHQKKWEPIDDELNELVDLMAPGMERLGDALFVALGDVYVALAICSSGETGPALQQQVDIFQIDRESLSEAAEVYGWEP